MSRPPSASLRLRLRVNVRRSRCSWHELPGRAAFFTGVRQLPFRIPVEIEGEVELRPGVG